jgi:hypothetical protein
MCPDWLLIISGCDNEDASRVIFMLYYIHIPKTAGTSLRSFLRNMIYGDKICEVYSQIRDLNEAEYRKSVKNREIYFGHFSYGFHKLLKDKNPSYVTVLRDPIARVVSLYNHNRLVQGSHCYDVINRENLSLCDFVELCLTHESNNHMVRILSEYGRLARFKYNALNIYSRVARNKKSFQVKSRRLLLKALGNIDRHFIYTGTTDRINDVAAFLADFHGIKLDNISVPFENVSTVRELTLDRSTRTAIENANELDLEIYSKISNLRRR